MPVKLERELKRRAAAKGLGKKRTGAYVYGTLRKTGWKPSREKNMSTPSKLVRLARIDSVLDGIIKFQTDEEDDQRKRSALVPAAAGAAVTAGGIAAHRAIRRTGGYGANIMAARYGEDLLGKATGNVAQNVGNVGAKLAPAYRVGANVAKSGASAFANVMKKIGGAATRFLESKAKTVQFGVEILGPWQGKKGHESKIDQLEFPAGLSPLAAMKLSLPQLMAYLNQRNLLQQVFSSKHKRLVELNSKLDDIKFISNEEEEERPKKTWKGAAGAGGLALGGYGTYKGVKVLQPTARYIEGVAASRKAGERGVAQLAKGTGPITWRESGQLLGRKARAFYKGARYARLSARIDDLIHFDQGWGAFPAGVNTSPLGTDIRYVPFRKPGAKEHFKRTAGRYAGLGAGLAATGLVAASDIRRGHGSEVLKALPAATGALAGGGLFTGAVVDALRQRHAVSKAVRERAPGDIAKLRKQHAAD